MLVIQGRRIRPQDGKTSRDIRHQRPKAAAPLVGNRETPRIRGSAAPKRVLLILLALAGLILWEASARVVSADKEEPVVKPANAPAAMEETPPVWTVLDPHDLKSAKGTTLTKQADKSILASGPIPNPETYTIQAHTTVKGITAIRLEVLTDTTMPQNGPGRAQNGNFVLNAFRVQAAPKQEPAKAQEVALSKATADFSQQDFVIQSAIDGNTPQNGGWAVSPQLSRKHVAVFELKTPLSHEEGTTLTFTLLHQYGSEHNIGRFRVSVASGKAPFPFYDELKSLVWSTLDPHEIKSARGTKLARQMDKSILASGPLPTPETYTIHANTALKGITAIRLEVLPDSTMPAAGPGRAGNGNFVLNGFQVRAAPTKEPAKAEAVALKTATADFSQQGYEVQTILTGNTPQGGGWAIDPQQGRKHVAVFELKNPISHDGGTTLTFTMLHNWAGGEHTIGRFRLSVATSKPPYPFELLDVTSEDMALFWTDLGSADAEKANQAAENLFQSGRALPMLRAQLKADVVKVDAKQVAKWIANLDDNEINVRENATSELEKLGASAAPTLMRAVELAPSLEARRRMERLLEKLKETPDVVRPQRAVELLARIGSPEARELLQNLANGSPDAVLTEAAKAALARSE
ncbi:MAG: hypothetical protein K2R98_19235 [Gemmataceae bacterium]|nr:hypothetical protein [Gemmataceae bacterium]